MSKLRVSHINRGAAVSIAIAAALWLSGCGSSSSSGSASSNPANNAVARATKKLGISPKREAAAARLGVIKLSRCLREHGIKVPSQPLSSSHPTFNLNGVNRHSAQFHTCLTTAVAEYQSHLYTPKTEAAAARLGVITFARCLRDHGIKVPAQPLSNPHPVFNEKGIDLKAPRVVAALHPCLNQAVAAHNARLRKG